MSKRDFASPAIHLPPPRPTRRRLGERRSSPTRERSPVESAPEGDLADGSPTLGSGQRILVVDIGGSKVKVLATGQSEARKEPSGARLTPGRLVDKVREMTTDWEYDVISLGYPGLVGAAGPCSEPGYLGTGWVGFDYAAAFQKPVRIVNDAAMQALGSYEGGRMLFLGLGTGVGSALIVSSLIIGLELGSLSFGKATLHDILGQGGFDRLGKQEWRSAVNRIAPSLLAAFRVEYVVVGGGNAEKLKAKRLPPGIRLCHNLTAFRGGFRLWRVDDVPTQGAGHVAQIGPKRRAEWRLL
jgi:polyphosphate glucokinase